MNETTLMTQAMGSILMSQFDNLGHHEQGPRSKHELKVFLSKLREALDTNVKFENGPKHGIKCNVLIIGFL